MMLFTWYLELRAFRSDLEASSYAPFIQRRFFKARSDFDGRCEVLKAPFASGRNVLQLRLWQRGEEEKKEEEEEVLYIQDARCDRCALLEAGCCLEYG